MKTTEGSRIPLDSPFFKEHRFLKKALGEFKPRSPQDECLLCQRAKAEKRASHIFSDFFTKSIFKDESKRKSYIFSDGKQGKVVPSVPKEDYILCYQCEGRLAALERLISLRLPEAVATMRKIGVPSEHTIEIGGVEPPLLHLFVYSLLWRAHISQLRPFEWLILEEEQAEELRQMLDRCLNTKKEVMIEEMLRMYPNHLPLYYQMATANQMPRGQFKLIFADGHDYHMLLGYCLNVSDFFISFHHSNEADLFNPNQKGASHPVDILVLDIKKWEDLIEGRKSYAKLRADTMNNRIDESSPLRPSID